MEGFVPDRDNCVVVGERLPVGTYGESHLLGPDNIVH